MNHYKYLVFDAQYFLTRNFKALSNSIVLGEDYKVNDVVVLKEDETPFKVKHPGFSFMDITKSFFWSIAKFCREKHSAEKVILVWDKYPYHKFEYLKDYKGDRHYASEEDLKDLDPILDAQKVIDTNCEIELLAEKQKAKYWIINNFDKLGMQSYIRTGYEADDYAGEIARYLEETDPTAKVGLVSVDSDWDYLVRPNADHLKPKGEVRTFDWIREKHRAVMTELEMDPYRFKAFYDSLYGSHNNMSRTVVEGLKMSDLELYKKVLSGDTSVLSNVERFKAQLTSFNITKFPDYDKFRASLYYLDKSGSMMDLVEYSEFRSTSGFGVTPNYYFNFCDGLNQNLYSKHD